MDRTSNVLIVDDKAMLRILRNLLRRLEFDNVGAASDGPVEIDRLLAGFD